MSTITNFWVANTQLSSNDRGAAGIDNATTYPLPAAVTPDEFRSWTLTRQNAYLDARGAGTPKSVTVGPVGGDQITVKRSASLAVEFQVADRTVASSNTASTAGWYAQNPADPVGLVAGSIDFSTAPASLDPRVYMSWRKADQVAYLVKNGVAAGGTLTIGTTNATFGNAVKATLVTDVEITGGFDFGTGSTADIPYLHLPGSAQGADALSDIASPFAKLDGQTNRLDFEDRPDDFDIDPTTLTTADSIAGFAAKFGRWHSAFQLEYVKTWGTSVTVNGVTSPAVLRLSRPDPDDNTKSIVDFEAFVSSTDPTQLYNADSLDKAAVARMTTDDQHLLAGMKRFDVVAARTGLSKVGSPEVTDVNGGKSTASQAIAKMRDYIEGPLNNATPPVRPGRAVSNASSRMPATDTDYFMRQLDVMDAQLAKMGAVSAQNISKTLSDIKERFDRAFAFWDVRAPATVTFPTQDADDGDGNWGSQSYVYVTNIDVTATDGIPGISQSSVGKGYATFVAQEKRRCEVIEDRQKLAGSVDARIDAPTLVYRFQSMYNTQKEAEVVAETEEINQQNLLLKSYAAIQAMVNETLGAFAEAGKDSKRLRGAAEGASFNSLSNRDKLVISMFEDVLANKDDKKGLSRFPQQLHPIEKLNNITRPTFDILNNKDKTFSNQTYNAWNIFAQRLGEAVTQINQNSQLKMNDVNSLDKERNRHFELANTALSKLSDTLQSIARAGG